MISVIFLTGMANRSFNDRAADRKVLEVIEKSSKAACTCVGLAQIDIELGLFLLNSTKRAVVGTMLPRYNLRRLLFVAALVLCSSVSVAATPAFVANRPPRLYKYVEHHEHVNDDDDISQEAFMGPLHNQVMNDDDDISQETFMEPHPRSQNGYRRIEDWHDDHLSKNPKRVLQQLQQEKARWAKTFEDLGGDGI